MVCIAYIIQYNTIIAYIFARKYLNCPYGYVLLFKANGKLFLFISKKEMFVFVCATEPAWTE